ncbi:MAG: hypothetical protein JW934_08605 [Anaerolineae bacterium]|nr:hypothetical protein [Anaerolineae bacterium]
MNLFPTTFQDILRLLMQPLHIAAIFPATVWTMLNIYIVIPIVYRDFTQSSWAIPTSLIAIIIFSYLLYVLNGPLIRFAEGYSFEWTYIGRWKKGKWIERYDNLLNEISRCEYQIQFLDHLRTQLVIQQLSVELVDAQSDPKIRQFLDIVNAASQNLQFLDEFEPNLKIRKALDKIEASREYRHIQTRFAEWVGYKRSLEGQKQFYYPASRTEIIPTRLGNIVAAFEGYAHSRYGMDAIYLWPRLTPILHSEGYAPFVEQEKAAFDFLLNLGYVSLFVGFELTFVFLLSFKLVPATLSFCFAPIIAYSFYLFSHSAAIHWGGRVKSAFDLYKEHLREKLHMRKPLSFDDEVKLWQRISDFYRSSGRRFEEFDYYRQSLPIVISEQNSVQASKMIVDETKNQVRFALILQNICKDKTVNEVKIIDFVETDMQPCDIIISDPRVNISHCRLDDWANAYQWTLGPIPDNTTIIVTYSLCSLKTSNLVH